MNWVRVDEEINRTDHCENEHINSNVMTRLVKFVYNFFLPKTVIQQQYEAICKQNDHFHTHGAWNRATCCI